MTLAGRLRRWLLRGLVLACLVGALTDPHLPASGPALPPVAVVDVSASVGRGPLAPPADVRIATSWLAVAETVREVEGRTAPPGLAREGTRLAEGLRTAAARWPGRDLWVFTDGRATDGDAVAAARAVAARGGQVHVTAPPDPAADVALLEARARRTADGRIVVQALIQASSGGTVDVRLVRDGRVAAQAHVALDAGARTPVALVDERPAPQGAAYAVRLEPGRGTPNDDPENDALEVGLPPDEPSVLIWGDLGVPAWNGADLGFRLGAMPAFETGRLHTADLLVVASVPWARIGEPRLRELRRFAAGGGRILLLGGPGSWAAGGWGGTALEEDLSPMRVPREEGEALALVLALDRSGSTADEARAPLQRAAMEAVRDLKRGEALAVLPFAAVPALEPLAPGWMTAADAPAARVTLEAALERLVPSGGTDLPAAIEGAAVLAAARQARTRRVLLLTDGDPDQRPDEAALRRARERLDAGGIEFGALVVGMPEAARRLRALVAHDPATVLLLDDATGLPSRLLHALSRERGAAEWRPGPLEVRWVVDAPDASLQALRPSGVQALETMPQGRVEAEAVFPTGAVLPFAARRQVGAGYVVALAWGPQAEDAPAEAALPLTGWIRRLAREADRGLTADLDGEDLVLRLPAAAGAGALLGLVPVSGAGDATDVALLERRPGLFRGRLPAGWSPGIRVRLPGGAAPRAVRLPARCEAEHRGAGVDEQALRDLAAAGGGLRLPAGVAPPPGRSPQGPALAPWLLLLAAILLVVDRAWTEGPVPSVRFPLEEEPAT